MFTGTGSFNGRIKSKQIRLSGDLHNSFKHFIDIQTALTEFLHLIGGDIHHFSKL
ncbi:hypothetical protein D3C81_1991360 [compost metagenome]